MKTLLRYGRLKCPVNSLSGSFLFIIPAIFFITFSVHIAEAFQAEVMPSEVLQGDAFMIKVTGLEEEPSAILGEKNLHFSRCGDGCFIAIAAMDVKSKPGIYRIPIKSGGDKTLLRVRLLKARFRTIRLTLPEEQVYPGPKDLERINKEDEMLDSIWKLESEKLWDGKFILPLPNPISTPFGTKRIINRKKISPHRGIDMEGKEGDGIVASNGGRVVLIEELFFGGKTVVIDHGQGIFTIYMHMSGFNVRPGSIVSKNDVIGFVGSSGRSSGPHLHFSVKVMRVNINPVSITKLAL